MPICIECRHPVETLWSWSSGHNIRLTVCKNCGRFCDKYVEHDYIVLFIDLVLIKPQVRERARSVLGQGRRACRARGGASDQCLRLTGDCV